MRRRAIGGTHLASELLGDAERKCRLSRGWRTRKENCATGHLLLANHVDNQPAPLPRRRLPHEPVPQRTRRAIFLVPTKKHEQGSEDLRRHRDAKTLEKPSPSGEGERRNERDGGSYVEAEALDVGVDGDALLLRRRLHLLDPHRRYRPPPPPISTRCVSRASLPPQQFREGREKWWGLLGAWAQNKSAGRQDSLGFRSFHLSEKYVNLH